jgi:proline dehydrogenase
VAGETTDDCLRVVRALLASNLMATVDFLGEDTVTVAQADRVTDTYVELLNRLAAEGLADRVEVSIKLSALGSLLKDGYELALDNARVICATAERAGTTVTVDMEDHTSTDATLRTVRTLRTDYPWVAAVLQAMLFRTSTDCAEHTGRGARVRLCKGAYAEPAEVAHRSKSAIDRNYKRCATILLEGAGRPLFATHDDAMIEHVRSTANRVDRSQSSYELQMLLGIRSEEQRRLAGLGHQVRVYVPFGTDWYAYFMRRLAERPANLMFLMRALVERPGKKQVPSGF